MPPAVAYDNTILPLGETDGSQEELKETGKETQVRYY